MERGTFMEGQTANPWLIMAINMTVVFAVLILLGVLMEIIHMIDPTKKKKVESAAPVAAAPVPAGAETVKAPMPGKILSVAVSAGQQVKKGETLLILEAMKMQNEIAAPHDATVTEVRVSANQTVATGDDMVVLG